MLGMGMAAMIGALTAAPPAEPRSDEPEVSLEWEAPARCPARHEVQRWLDRALSDSSAEPGGLRASAVVRTSGEGATLVLDLRLRRPDAPEGRRVMEAGDCRELAKAAVLIVALAVDPNAAVETPELETPEPEPSPAEPEPPELETPPPEPESTTSELTEPEPEPETDVPQPTEPEPDVPQPTEPDASELDRALRVGLRAHGAAGLSVLPAPTGIVSLTGAVWGQHWRAELGASYWSPVISRPDGTAGGRIEQWTIDARGCGVLRPGPLELPLCGGLDVGAVHGRGRGVADPQRVTSLRLALAAGPALVWRPARLERRLGLWIGADLLVALVRARFRATPSAPGLVVYTPPVGARAGAGIEVRFR